MNKIKSGRSITAFITAAIALGIFAIDGISITAKEVPGASRQSYEIFVDSGGVMRRSDTGAEVSYYGTNYTAPFAYSYRALKREGHDIRKEIDKDVYHMARLGFNAFRLHLWDAELADSIGNLVDNEHLDLLDYLIAKLEERGIDIILTAQTNFGNGYPERNIDTGAFTYDYDKCEIHDNPEAQSAQERYLAQLLSHHNPYTGRTLGDDKAIIAWEINNEPCHSGTNQEVTAYIDRMTKAMRSTGYSRPILYNVTHNPDVTKAYYDAADIQGTTYQWYPTGLVAGHMRTGNFLPALDNYNIPWEDSIPAYERMARVVYEFDPADVLYSHLYPAIARTFRSKGFQWITQFAYDPLALAQYNTEYPTHYLNLAYTPAKALSMMIATKTAGDVPRGADYGKYPHNTSFGYTTISHDPDLSIYNSPESFIYTNTTETTPIEIDKLRHVAGHGSSPIVNYPGSGAYFLDATSQNGIWRIEIMPDVTITDDPFGATSVNDAKLITTARPHVITVKIPSLGDNFSMFDMEGKAIAQAGDGSLEINPGTWLLAADGVSPDIKKLTAEKVAGNIGITEYVAPAPARTPVGLLHAMPHDSRLDAGMIPEAWEFRLDYRNPSWDLPAYYRLGINPTRDAVTVIRRNVIDKISRIPENINPDSLNMAFLTEDPEDKSGIIPSIPDGTEIAVVTSDGYTYSAPVTIDQSGRSRVALMDLKPRKGIIIPAPYPTMMTREIPAPTDTFRNWRDIEFIELIIPSPKHDRMNILLKEIWLE